MDERTRTPQAAQERHEEPVSRRRLATRTRLLDAARSVFASRGVHGASVEEICEVAGFTRGAFYSNYSDKDDLTRDLLRREQDRILATVEADGPTGDIDAAVEAVLAAQRPSNDYFLIQSELSLHALRTREFAPVLEEHEATFRHIVEGVLTRELARLGLRPLVSTADLTETVLGLVNRSIRNAALAGEDDLLRLARTTLPHVLRGLTRPEDSDAPDVRD